MTTDTRTQDTAAPAAGRERRPRGPRRIEGERASDPDACREAALKLIERTRRTRSDLERRLADKGYARAVIGPVLERLAEVGLVDDTEYARAWLAGRWGRRPSGWRRLQQELRAKGVADADIEAARTLLAERGGAPDEAESAARLVEQARRRMSGLDPRKRRQRLYALLARRGYSADVIRRALGVSDALESGQDA